MTLDNELNSDSGISIFERPAKPSDTSESDNGDFGRRGLMRRLRPGWDRSLPVLILVAWLPLLAYLALLTRTPRVPVIPGTLASPLAHIATSAVLVALLYWILSVRITDRRGRIRSALISAGLASGAGFALELVQSWYSNVRLFEGSDILSNVLGATLSAMLLVTLADLGVSRRILSVGTVGMVTLITGGVFASIIIWNPAYPYRGDHWHVQYLVDVCGELLPPFGAFPGGIHTHSTRVIHLHPRTADEEGANATLGLFFQRAGGELNNETLELPSGETYSNGDLCGDGSEAELTVWDYDPRTQERVFRIDDPGDYVPHNFQTILIEFVAGNTFD